MFDVTFKNVPEKALGDLIALVGTKKFPVKLTHRPHPDQVDIKTKNGNHGGSRKRMSPDTPLMLTHKSAKKGTKREEALTRFKKLEQKHGPGGVTRKMFRTELDKMKCDKSTLNSLIRSGFLRHVEN